MKHERNPEPLRTDAEPFGERSANHCEPLAVNNGTEWRTVAQVAQLLGVTSRAIQKRCQSGRYNARRVQTPKGEAWEIDAQSIEATANDPEPFAQNTTNNPEPTANRSHSKSEDIPGQIFPVADQNAPADWKQREADFRSEIQFLRDQLGEANRNAAEIRAALRESLRAQPRQLTSGTPEASPNIQPGAILQTKALAKPNPETIPTIENDSVLSDEEINELCQSFFREKQ